MATRLVCPIQHPGYIVRGAWEKEPCQEVYLRRLWSWIKGKRERPTLDTSRPPIGSTLFPTVEDLRGFQDELSREEWNAVSIDIENAGPHIICIGLTQLDLLSDRIGRTLCVRFRHRGGKPYWKSRQELLAVVQLLFDVLADARSAKVFHNGVVHDVPILQSLGFQVRGRLIDTMNLAHACYPELPKSLQFTATLYLWSSVWKTLVDEDEEEEGKG